MSGVPASPADAVILRGLRVLGICGVLPEETQRPQPLELDLWLAVDTSRAASSDDLAFTVDYSEVTRHVVDLVEGTRFALLEALAGRVAELCLGFEGVRSATVEARKLRPPVPADLATAGVRVTRP